MIAGHVKVVLSRNNRTYAALFMPKSANHSYMVAQRPTCTDHGPWNILLRRSKCIPKKRDYFWNLCLDSKEDNVEDIAINLNAVTFCTITYVSASICHCRTQPDRPARLSDSRWYIQPLSRISTCPTLDLRALLTLSDCRSSSPVSMMNLSAARPMLSTLPTIRNISHCRICGVRYNPNTR